MSRNILTLWISDRPSVQKTLANFEQKPYFQVFEERNGFLKNLSIVDLLFNQGPQAGGYLASPDPSPKERALARDAG